MNHEELQILLVEYIDGSIPSEQKTIIEEALRSSPRLREEFEDIRLALTALQIQTIPEVPAHYFANFVPRLRERIDGKSEKHSIDIPEWVQKIFRPVAVFTIVGTFLTFYQLFQPGIQQQQVHEIVQSAQIEDMNEFSNYTTLETDDAEQFIERLSELLSHNSLDQQMQNSFAINSGHLEGETNQLVYASIEPIVSELNDEEMNLVIETIDFPTKN